MAELGPLCVGIDPSPALLGRFELPDSPDGLRAFCEICIEALSGVVAVVKPQVAFFERHGAAGLAAFERVVAVARDAGMLVIADAKRGDIASSAEAYADAWFRGPLAADALTASPYVGVDALLPMVLAARATGRGLIVVVTSSNPEGREVQGAVLCDGSTVEQAILGRIGQWNAEELAAPAGPGRAGLGRAGPGRAGPGGAGPGPALGSVGAVVGATGGTPPQGLGELGGVVLAPGLGAQGATVSDVARRFSGCPPRSVLPAASRGLLSCGPEGLHAAAGRLRDELAAVLP